MFRGFNLKLNEELRDYTKLGEELYSTHQTDIVKNLKSFLSEGGKISGNRLQEHWFPEIKADVFISYCHKDERIAKSLAGWIYKNFGLMPFIDSCVWGYVDDLLKIIDDDYCKNLDGETYNYGKRNGSTSHVHMMLSTALSMMIDNTECLIFLNTPNSITSNEIIEKTESPWIFHEIALTNIIRRKYPKEHREPTLLAKSLREAVEARVNIEYELNTTNLTSINESTLRKWIESYQIHKVLTSKSKANHPLDILYQITS